MKLKFTFTIFGLFLMAFILMSNAGGRAAAQGIGNTGAPGDNANTCSGGGGCHSGGQFGTELEIAVLDADGLVVTEYLPGVSYTVEARVNTSTTPSGYGLQLVSLIDGSQEDTGGLTNASNNAQISSLSGRDYLEQAGISSSELFSATWTAPVAESGPVTFYASGHAANGNGQTSGDQANSVSLNLTEKATSSITDLSILELEISPNPVFGFTIISLENQMNGNVLVYDLLGKVIKSQSFNSNQVELDLNDVNSGVYFVKVMDLDSDYFGTKRIIKN